MNNKSFSVLISVYKNDNPAYFRTAIESVSIKQTVQPDEVYVYVDGPVPDALANTIKQLEAEILSVNVHWETENKGLGRALQYGMEHVSNEIVARMDSDDISVPDRFEKQLYMFDHDKNLSVAGGDIIEFIDTSDNIVGKRLVPTGDTEIRKYMRKRDALNHVTVMFKKSDVLRSGNYQDWFYNEDSYLWVRMMLAGCKFGNIPETLVKVRVGRDMYARRGGWRYFKSELNLQNFRLENKVIGIGLYLFNVLVRFVVQVLMPNKIRAFFFQKVIRK